MKTALLAFVLVLTFLALFLTSSSFSQQTDPERKKKVDTWMKTKLDLSRNILSGLTEEDFKKISDHAEGLFIATFFESLLLDREDYRQQVKAFEIATQELIRESKAKNLSGATLAYNHVVASCVRCHVIVRDAKKAANGAIK